MIKFRVGKMTFENIAELEVTVFELWEELCTPELCRKLYRQCRFAWMQSLQRMVSTAGISLPRQQK